MHLFSLDLHIERSERSRVLRESALDGCQFSNETFNAVTDGHTGRDAVRVDDHIRNDTFDGEGQVLLTIGHTASSFLSMSRGELITYLRNPHTSHSHLRKLIACGVFRHDHQVHYTSFSPSGTQRRILKLSTSLHRRPLFIIRRSQYLSYKDFLILDCLARRDDTVSVEFQHCLLEDLYQSTIRLADLAHGTIDRGHIFFGLVGSVESRTVETAFNCGLVENDTILLVVASEACHSHNRISTDWHLED